MKTKLFCLIALSASTRLFAATAASEEFVAHEWGTFTSVQGADGVPIEWNPLIKTDLPKFVYSRAFVSSYGRNVTTVDVKSAMPSFVRMETPVIYFYSEEERTADVRVSMPQGRITEWYPRATRVGPYTTTNKAEAQAAGRSFIEWTGVKILSRDTKEISAGKLIVEKGGNHYYEARETDANFVRVAAPYESSGAEYERDLFYRGVGFFTGPLTLGLQDKESYLQLSTRNSEPLTDLFVLTSRNGMARYQYVDQVSKDAERGVKLASKPFAPLSDVRPQIMREMAAALTKQGLYAKEAEAMVNTWKDQWFSEEGTRVLYLLPHSWTDQTLPLTISPEPSHIVRVMVGRAELITPTMEMELRNQVTRFSTGDSATKANVLAEVRKLGLGRFLEPATRKMLGKTPNKEFAQAAWSLAQEASKPAIKDGNVVEKEPAASATRKATAASTSPHLATR
jgi:hypothetical protein